MNKNIRNFESDIYKIDYIKENEIYIMRDDLIPFSFGGNKARKMNYFLKDIEKKQCNYVITYGSSSSNHCRIVSNICSQNGYGCTIISPNVDKDNVSYNEKMCKLFGAEILNCDIDNVKQTIDSCITSKKTCGFNPYFIQGGGHGNLGVQAYVDAYTVIKNYEIKNNIKFDYIFHATGTGTTQAGLIIGKILNNDECDIVGISIARKENTGKEIIIKSIEDYIKEKRLDILVINSDVIFIDDYVFEGYGHYNNQIEKLVQDIMINAGIPLDTTYTGKAFYGMMEYIKKENLKDMNILFVHTGGTPIFFDYLKEV